MQICQRTRSIKIIIHEGHWLVPLYITECHMRVYHSGVNDTLVNTRDMVWIVRGRQVIRKWLRRCVACKIMQGASYNQEMAPLPKDRLTEGSPFKITGIDFFGPLYVKEEGKRNSPAQMKKSYGLILTCASTRAIHLELLSSMNTTTFLQALKRFISRRGTPSIIYSDNAKTFKKASKILEFQGPNILTDEEIQSFVSNRRITWKFIAERAPWWGGMWERLIRSVKHAARKKLRNARLSYEEMETMLVEIEGMINSRPLTYVYSHPKEPSPISPSTLLIGERITAWPEEIIADDSVWNYDVDESVARRLKYRQTLSQNFWNHWRNEYLSELKKAHRNFKETRIPKVGDVCVISDDNIKRCLWPLGIITQTYEGHDGKIRSVQLRSRGKLLIRPIQRLVPYLRKKKVEMINLKKMVKHKEMIR